MRRSNPVRALLPEGTFWHGTESVDAAAQILRSRVLIPGASRYSGVATPRRGRVYLSRNALYAVVYAIGGAMVGYVVPKTRIQRVGRYGYLFEVAVADDADVTLDEDQVGQLAASGTPSWLGEMGCEIGSDIDYEGEVEGTTFSGDVSDLWSAATDGYYDAWIQLGHELLDNMNDEQQEELLAYGTQFAVAGEIRVLRAWKVDKTRTAFMREGDFESVLAEAERIL
jgi:hypothetical protein